MMLSITQPLTDLKGIGPAKAKKFYKLGIYTVEDFVRHYPKRYYQRGVVNDLNDFVEGETVTIQGEVIRKRSHYHRGKAQESLTVQVLTQDREVSIIFFNAKFVKNMIFEGESYMFFGPMTRRNMQLNMQHPEFCHVERLKAENFVGWVSIYGLTEGVSQRECQKLARQIFAAGINMEEPMPSYVVERHALMPINDALKAIHLPMDRETLMQARERLVFDELFELQLSLLLMKDQFGHETSYEIDRHPDIDVFIASLPYALTGAQSRVVDEIFSDCAKGVHLNRLVQGDVGSGKTLVALLAMYNAILHGYQAAMMAPTEILAEQHYKTLSMLLPESVNLVLLTGKSAKKKEALQKIASGEADLVVGTHAVIAEKTVFKKLGFVVTDEQHRFGVKQRQAMLDKGRKPHLLVMSATPIPRTLGLILYGDMNVSVIDEKPGGRKVIKTHYIPEKKRQGMYEFVSGELKSGRQAYVVCPLVEESDVMELTDAASHAKRLAEELAPFKVGLVHGKMKRDEKDAVMKSFAANAIQVLVSTTVIEVGIDVPNATIMIIEDAERFGLAQLHQLRGRVGRGEWQSYCFLMSSHVTEVAKERIVTMTQTDDGFVIANKDLAMRGPGELLGVEQHGIPTLRIASLQNDQDVLERVQETVKMLIASYQNGQKDVMVYIDQWRKKLYERFTI